MDWGRYFNSQALLSLAFPVGIGIVIAGILYVVRLFLYKYIHRLAAKTKTCFDDIMVRDTRIASLLWCIWLGIYVGWKIAVTPTAWSDLENQVIPVLFVANGIYTAITIIMAVLKWYKAEISPRTTSNLDDAIMNILIIGTPIVGGGLGIILVLRMLGIESEGVNKFLADHGARLLAVTFVTVFFILLTALIIPRIIDSAVRGTKAEQTEDELKKRSDTLISVIETTIQIVIIFIFLLMVLSEFTINITAFITGASVLGLAIGFGAQSVVKDVLAGLFIIMENQYRKGDVVKIAGESGVVEEINLRRTILRDLDGITHIVPNGEIRVASNYTKQWSRVNFNISVSYSTDLDKAIAVINRVGKEMAVDPKWAPDLLSPPAALRVDNLGDSGIEIKILGETKPIRQWDVMGELRLRLKKAFDKEGIEIPWPHTKVYFGNIPPQLKTGDGEETSDKSNQSGSGIS